MSELKYCTVELDGCILIVTLNCPERLNALPFPAHEEIERVFDNFERDKQLRVAIITGAGGKAFCAGNDLKYQAEGHSWPKLPKGFAGLTGRFGMSKPIIAAVNGLAVGGGFEIVLACDIVVAVTDAYFALPEPRVGMAALSGGLHRLPRQIPFKHAMGMILTGRHVRAQEAYLLGIVNEVVPNGEALQAAKRWAVDIVHSSPTAISASKQVAYQGLSHASLQEAMEAHYPAIDTLLRSADYEEGPRAFKEKRKAIWSEF